MKALTPAHRRYVYSVLVAVGGAVVFYGVATGEEVAVWLNVAAVGLMTGGQALARANTPGGADDGS